MKELEELKLERIEIEKIREGVVSAGGDRGDFAKSCGFPRSWTPGQKIEDAAEWIYVPTMIESKTYPRFELRYRNGRIQTDTMRKDGVQVKVALRAQPRKNLIECDFILVHFKGNKLLKVDRSQCQAPLVRADSQEACEKLLGLR